MSERKYLTADQIGVAACPVDEQETTIQVSRDEGVLNIWSSDNTMITKLRKCVEEGPDTWKCWEGSRDADGRVTGYFFSAPRKMLTLRANPIVRDYTDEQRAEMAERMRMMARKDA